MKKPFSIADALAAETGRCDFCQSASVLVTVYRAEAQLTAHYADDSSIEDDGQWGACVTCKGLIDARRWNDLIERAITGTQQRFNFSADRREWLRGRFKVILQTVFGEKFAA